MDLCNINDIRALLGRHGFRFSKGLGQNFLCDPAVPRDIAEGAYIDENTCVLEVGPGIGCLTEQLCMRARKVVSVELDTRLGPVLHETMAEHDNFTLVRCARGSSVSRALSPAPICLTTSPARPLRPCWNAAGLML